MGIEHRTRPSAFEESLGAIRRLLDGDVVSSSGRFTFREARATPRPPERVEYWIHMDPKRIDYDIAAESFNDSL